jgi:vitamin B12 transporter
MGTRSVPLRYLRRLSPGLVFLCLLTPSSIALPQSTQDANPAKGTAPPPVNSSPSSNAKPLVRTVVTVTGQPVSVSLAPASVSVVDNEQIRNTNPLTSADLMRTMPFVNLEQNGSAGSLSTLTIRGGKPNLVLVLIDGIPVNDLTNLLGGSFDFSTLLTHDLERVEVVRGPLSSGYGSEAMSGVINAITRPTHYESNLTAGVETGSFGTAGLNLGAQGSKGQFGYKLNGAFLRVGEQVLSDGFSTGSFSTSSDYVLGSASTISWTVRWFQFQGSSFPANGGGPELSILRIPETSNSGNFLAGFVFQHLISKVWQVNLNVDVFSRGEHSYTPPILDAPNPSPFSQPSILEKTRFTRPRLTLQNVFNLSSKWQAHFNLQGGDEIGKNNTVFNNAYPSSFSTNRGVANANMDLVFFTNRMTGMAAIGINKTAGFNTEVAPRVGAAVTVAKGTILKASWGQAYRVPDLYALENPNVGNPNLLPEKVTGLDAGLQHRFGDGFTLSATYYYNLFADLIDFSSTAFRLVNRNHVRTQGVETEASLSLAHRVQIRAWGSILDWKIESSSEPLRDQPDWQAGFNVDTTLPKQVRFSSTTLWVGRRYDFQLPAPTVGSVGGYSTTNLILGYEGFRSIGLFARVDNIFNLHFHEYLGFPNPGISCRVGVTYHLR